MNLGERALFIFAILKRMDEGLTLSELRLELERDNGDVVCEATIRRYLSSIEYVGTHTGLWALSSERGSDLLARYKLEE